MFGCHFLLLAAVIIDSKRLQAEMKYWLCSADGETADVLLHIMAQETVKGMW
jgi:hypothetical protein